MHARATSLSATVSLLALALLVLTDGCAEPGRTQRADPPAGDPPSGVTDQPRAAPTASIVLKQAAPRANEIEPGIVDVHAREQRFGEVLANLARQCDRPILVADRAFLEEILTVDLEGIRLSEALAVLAFIMQKTLYSYPEGFYLDWACTNGDPGLGECAPIRDPGPLTRAGPSTLPNTPCRWGRSLLRALGADHVPGRDPAMAGRLRAPERPRRAMPCAAQPVQAMDWLAQP